METYVRAAEGDEPVRRIASMPFIHKIATRKNRYIFDVGTGEILRVDDVVWEIIEDSYLGREEVIAKYTPRFTRDQIMVAYDEIQEARTENGFFSDYHPKVGTQIDKEYVSHLLDSCRTGLTLNVTEQCNFRCTYCPNTYSSDGSPRHSERSMSWETAQAAIDDFLRHYKVSEAVPESEKSQDAPTYVYGPAVERLGPRPDLGAHIGFYGGEPLLNFPLIKRCTEYILAKLADRKVTFVISTNGYLLKGEVADFLGANKFHIRVSLDGPPSIHDRQRRTVNDAPTWAVVAGNIRAFTTKYPEHIPMLGATVGPTADLREIGRYLATADWIAPLQSVSTGFADEPYPGYNASVAGADAFPGKMEVYETYLRNLVKGRLNLAMLDRELELQRRMFSAFFLPLHRWRWSCAAARHGSGAMAPGGPCVPGVDKMLVSVTGEYFLCEKAVYYEACRIGDISTGIDKEKAYAMLKEFTECTRGQCEHCWCLPMCPAGCYISVCRKGGPRAEVTKTLKEQVCEDGRTWRHERLVEYCSVLEKNPKAFDHFCQYLER